jgi:hypothetical protein
MAPVTDDPAATAGPGYWYHQERQPPAASALDDSFQHALVEDLGRLTDVQLP